jgi:type II secretory ATPase GspE/PulE/Tfp pilus assembly ATPase PilB-like protein
VIGQRLARRLCDTCKRPADLREEELAELGAADLEATEIHEPAGCVACNGTGYRGRIGLFEVLVLTDEVRSLIMSRAPATELEVAALAAGMHSLRADGLEKVRQGITSLPEVVRVLGSSAG